MHDTYLTALFWGFLSHSAIPDQRWWYLCRSERGL